MKVKFSVFVILSLFIFACTQTNKGEKAEMYQHSEMASLMQDMVAFSKDAKSKLQAGDSIASIPINLWDLKTAKGTRDEQLESTFQSLANPYLNALQGIERGDSQMYYYNASIDACKGCHASYCGGPLVIINKLPLEQ